MISYQTLKDKPKRFQALTGLTPEEFSELSPCFSICFLEYVQTYTLEGKQRKKRRYTSYKNSCFDTNEDMLLFILIYLRKAMTQDVLGELFDMAQPLTNRWIHLLLPILNRSLAELGDLPSRETSSTNNDVLSDTSTGNEVRELFFMMLPSVLSNARKTHKLKRLIIVVKRNNIRSKITLLSTQKAKLCF